MTRPASCSVVTMLGATPERPMCSRQTSIKASSTAYLYVAVNDPWSNRVQEPLLKGDRTAVLLGTHQTATPARAFRSATRALGGFVPRTTPGSDSRTAPTNALRYPSDGTLISTSSS